MPSNDTENIYATQYGGEGEPIPASKISYDNTESGLQATKVQGAIDEIADSVNDLTEFETKVPNGYLYMGSAQISAIVENGTYSGCLDTIATNMLTTIQALEDDEIVIPDLITIVGFNELPLRNKAYNNTETSISLHGSTISSSAAYLSLLNGVADSGSTASTLHQMQYTVESTTWAFSDVSALSAGASRTIQCRYQKYKKIK